MKMKIDDYEFMIKIDEDDDVDVLAVRQRVRDWESACFETEVSTDGKSGYMTIYIIIAASRWTSACRKTTPIHGKEWNKNNHKNPWSKKLAGLYDEQRCLD